MHILSICRSEIKSVVIRGREVLTGIYKEPVSGPVAIHELGLDGDAQADLTVHGGIHQAVYAYPAEHYPHWQSFLRRDALPHGTFGENVTSSGLIETEVFIGDVHRYGSAFLQVTSTRLPCFKFAHKIGDPSILKPFTQSGRTGFYYRVIEAGVIAPGDAIEVVQRDPRAITVRTALGLYRLNEGGRDLLETALQIDALSPPFREGILARLLLS